jgi:hypothetical protein
MTMMEVSSDSYSRKDLSLATLLVYCTPARPQRKLLRLLLQRTRLAASKIRHHKNSLESLATDCTLFDVGLSLGFCISNNYFGMATFCQTDSNSSKSIQAMIILLGN